MEKPVEAVEKPTVKVGVGVIIRKDDKFLVGRRQGSHGEGMLAFPGGHVEANDGTLKKCGEREVFEETFVICNVISPDNVREELFTTFDILSEDKSKVYATIYLFADYICGGKDIFVDNKWVVRPREPDKCKYWEWLTLEEIAEIVGSESQSWIPLTQVAYYIKKIPYFK